MLYFDLFQRLYERSQFDPNCSHSLIVLLACGIFGWRGWRETKCIPKSRLPGRSIRLGVLSLLAGLFLHAAANTFSSLMIGTVGLVFVLRGFLWLTGGRKALRAYGFAVGYLVFLAPVPPLLRQPVVNSLQSFVSMISAQSLELAGIPVFQNGIILHLPGFRLEVAEGCSGMRQLMAFIAASIAVAGWFRLLPVSKTLLLAAAIPVAVLSNVFRIFLTGLVYHFLGAEWAKGTFHTLEGLTVVVIGATAMFWLGSILVAWDGQRRVTQSTRATIVSTTSA